MPLKRKQKKVLVVEDEKPMAHALELKLSKADFEVVVASDGEEAINCLQNGGFDLILLDIMLPKLDGFGVLEKMKELKINTPVIMSSNLGQEEDKKKALSMGAVDYIIKSDVPIAEIVEKVKQNLK